MATGTLEKLNLKTGDVVAHKNHENVRWSMTRDGRLKGDGGFLDESYFAGGERQHVDRFYIVSRATPDSLPYGHVTLSDGRTVDLTANRVPCGLMDPEELQALKDHDGPYEIYIDSRGWDTMDPYFSKSSTCRVKPQPVVKTKVWYWGSTGDFSECRKSFSTHKHTLTIQDGDIINTKTEKL